MKLSIIFFLLLQSCTTIVLDNDSFFNVSSPDPLVFKKPTCLDLTFKTHNVGEFNEDEGLKEMGELQKKTIVSGLDYYNIVINCESPVASYGVVSMSKSRNRWAKS